VNVPGHGMALELHLVTVGSIVTLILRLDNDDITENLFRLPLA